MKHLIFTFTISCLILNTLAKINHINPIIKGDVYVNDHEIIRDTTFSISKKGFLFFIEGTPANSIFLSTLDDDEKHPGFSFSRISSVAFIKNESNSIISFQVNDKRDDSRKLNVSIRTSSPHAGMLFEKLKKQ